ncbi:C2 family cysteine protease [Cylindrospermum stagnale]|uniref:C2 family cysteine protease n=1 Tax=Cylindrospermum stagnale TaxID=142864 RepID=UPI0012F68CBC|nr:C2 family cysteine protease [Cylindrospermum stagnale]
MKSSKTPDNYSSLKLLMEIFKNDQNKVDQWITFVKGVKGNELKQKFINQGNDQESIDPKYDYDSRGNSNIITLQDIEKLFKDQAFKDDIMEWLRSQKLFPGDLGTAIYSQIQLDTFKKIKVALISGQVVAAGSYTYISEQTGTEEKTPDKVAGGHAYAVLAVRTTNSQNPEDSKAGKFHWVKLSNPQKSYFQKYDFRTGKFEVLKDKSNDSAQFWLELSDFTKNFSRLDIGSF